MGLTQNSYIPSAREVSDLKVSGAYITCMHACTACTCMNDMDVPHASIPYSALLHT